ncbi:Wrky transcription factor 19, partial [Globisporangium splendens]
MTGMTRVVIIQDSNITQKYQELLRKLETLGGQKIGRHRMFMLRMSQNDDLVYAVLVNEHAKQQHVAAVSDNGIEGSSEECSLLECGLDGANILQQVEIYAFKSDGQFEGTQYAVGDFVVSVCTFMSRNNQPRGLVIEVQYSPCYTVSSVETLFDEFLANFAQEDRLRKPIDNMHALFDKVFGTPSSAEYSLKHTALQSRVAASPVRRTEESAERESERVWDRGARATRARRSNGLAGRSGEQRSAGDMEEEMAAAAVLFGGDDPRFDVVDLDASVLPPSFAIPYEPQMRGNGLNSSNSNNNRLSLGLLSGLQPTHSTQQQHDLRVSFRVEPPPPFHQFHEQQRGDYSHQYHREDLGANDDDDDGGALSKQNADDDAKEQQQLLGMMHAVGGANAAAMLSPTSSSSPPTSPHSSTRTSPDDTESHTNNSNQNRRNLCQHDGCDKFAQGGGLCIAHGGGYKCKTPFCAFFNTRTCEEHGGSKRCGILGCTKVALGVSALCCAHGGGRKCSVKKCDKHDAGLGFCLAHGGGRNCTVEGCTKKQIRYGVCSGHGGRARCKEEGCEKYDRGQGKCKSHGGGYFCKVEGCTKKDKGGGLCAGHGGGKKCYVEGCNTPCVGGGRCKLHGGGKRCQAESCSNWALNGGKCKDHGGTGKRCSRRGCDKHDQGGGYCLAHGGGYKCTIPDCSKKQVCVACIY